ncbi:MAG TPA: glycosyltransferase [Candidatus Baltobacteraceae bacterium]|nr:glycosyltransferase [Candidatus Baltobacteraceae bacterium]
MRYDLVIPTIGRPSLLELLQSLERCEGPLPQRIFIVDDRRDASVPLVFDGIDTSLARRISVLRGKAAGPAAARNTGWRASDAEWIAFLDDDVIVRDRWLQMLVRDIEILQAEQAGSQGRVHVPLPHDRPATDWERNVAGLASSAWITADMVYRRSVLRALNGFDERFKRAYREDADFALRVFAHGYRIARGSREIDHPVRPADPWISVRLQAGNADDVLMSALHGKDWRGRAGAPRGRWPYHLATVACFAGWAALTGEFAWRRLKPGPRTPRELRTIVLTSAVIPFAAVYHRTRALLTLRSRLREAHE